MRILKMVIGIILLGGRGVDHGRSYKGRGKSSWLVLLFAMFLVTLGSYFLVDSVAALHTRIQDRLRMDQVKSGPPIANRTTEEREE
jgi:hypothetical protein